MENDILKIENQLCFRLYSVSREMTRAYEPWLKKFNLTYPQYVVMLVLFEHKRIDFNELSKIVELKTGTLTPMINKLRDNGYLLKEKNEQDGRKVFIELSEKGKELNKEVIEVPLSVARELDIPIERYEALVKELDQLKEVLNRSKNINRKSKEETKK